ncbi:hypothetical protein GCM10025777_11730 [Membranihabitans marinus]
MEEFEFEKSASHFFLSGIYDLFFLDPIISILQFDQLYYDNHGSKIYFDDYNISFIAINLLIIQPYIDYLDIAGGLRLNYIIKQTEIYRGKSFQALFSYVYYQFHITTIYTEGDGPNLLKFYPSCTDKTDDCITLKDCVDGRFLIPTRFEILDSDGLRNKNLETINEKIVWLIEGEIKYDGIVTMSTEVNGFVDHYLCVIGNNYIQSNTLFQPLNLRYRL